MHFRYWPIVPALLYSIGANAQEEWDVYMARFGEKPGSIMVDMGLINRIPDKLLPYVVVTGPKAKDRSDKNGLPSAGEIEDMERVLDLTGSILSGATPKKLAGTFTCNHERLNYYYVRDTANVRNALTRMYGKHFSDRSYTVKIKPDPDWLVYRNFLYPDSASREWMASNRIISQMRTNGDDLSRPRDIQHMLYFMVDDNRSRFADSARVHHFKVSSTNAAAGMNKSLYEITVSRFGEVRMDSILAAEAELKNLAAPLGGIYKTWAAPR